MSTDPMPNVNFLEPTIGRATLIWWALFWRGILLAFAAAVAVNMVGEAVGAMAGLSSHSIRIMTTISSVIAAMPVGIFVVELILRKRFREFRIYLTRN
jgi:hypothetical protein